MARIDKRHEAAILKLRYAKADFEYTKMVVDTMSAEFDSEFLNWCAKNDIMTAREREELRAQLNPITEEQAEKQFKPDSEEMVDGPNKKNPETRRIYKKIAAKIHPDKLAKASQEFQDEMAEVFAEATRASDENDWYTLYNICMDLGIKTPRVTKQQVKMIEQKADEYLTKVEKFKNSYAWVYDNSESEDEKEKLFESFAKRTGCVKRTEEKESE